MNPEPTPDIYQVATRAQGPQGELPLTPQALLQRPSGDIFALSQNAGMGWNPNELNRPEFLLLSTQGGIRNPDGTPLALPEPTTSPTDTRKASVPFCASVPLDVVSYIYLQERQKADGNRNIGRAHEHS